jgi:peptidoglycan/xylan/chitin deacetylase (PgdA/CDA1 family)
VNRSPACRAIAVCFLFLTCSAPSSAPPSGGQGGSGGKAGSSPPTAGGSGGGSGGAGTSGNGGGSPVDASGGGGKDSGSSGGGAGADAPPGNGGPSDGAARDSAAGSPDSAPSADPAGIGCIDGTCLNPGCTVLTTAAVIAGFAEIGFEEHPAYIPPDVIVPTFDDVPDGPQIPATGDFGAGDWTKKIVQYLDSTRLHFDFFINTNNFCDVLNNPGCMDTVTSILRSHYPGNHTVHHVSMGIDNKDLPLLNCDTPASVNKPTCEAEMMGVEAVINTASKGARPHLTRFRAPFGAPYELDDARVLAHVRPIVSRYAVHVGWNIDSGDALCDTCRYTGQQIADMVIAQIGTGPGKGTNHGIVLMHGVFPGSFDAARILFDPRTGYAQTHGFRLANVEDVICWKYGKHSWQIVEQLTGQKHDPN